VEDATIEHPVLGFLARAEKSPLALAFGEIHEVRHRLRRIQVKETANNVSFGGFKCRVHSGLTGHKNPFE
jgi:hypothetical protein